MKEVPRLEDTRRFWEENPVARGHIGPVADWADYFKRFDRLREAEDVEPYEFSNLVHGYEQSAGMKILDYGCGNGYVLSKYAANGADVCGIDITESAIEACEARFALLGLRGEFATNDGLTVPFEDDQFDVVCSMGVLHHIPDPRPAVAELYRVLKPGGRLIVMVYHRNSYRYRVTFPWRKLFGRPGFRGKSIQQQVNMNDGEGNPLGRVYSPSELQELLGAFTDPTFRVNKLGSREVALYSRNLNRVMSRAVPKAVTRYLARRLGWNLYCTARKP